MSSRTATTEPFTLPLPTVRTKVYNWRQKGVVAQSASALIMEYMGAFDDTQMAKLHESWEGLGLVRQRTFPSKSSMARTASVKAMYEKDDVQTLVRGAWVFKHGRRGRPKRRKVRVNADLTTVVWGTGKQMAVEVRCYKLTRGSPFDLLFESPHIHLSLASYQRWYSHVRRTSRK